MVEDHRHAAADLGHPLADDIHLRVVGVDVEGPAELLEQVDAVDEALAQRQRARILVELHDAADAADQRMPVAHLAAASARPCLPHSSGAIGDDRA